MTLLENIKELSKRFTKKFNKDPSYENLNENSKKIVRQWINFTKSRPNNLNDPLIIIEWNQAGCDARTNINPQFTKEYFAALIRAQPGYVQFPPTEPPSDISFTFVDTPAAGSGIQAVSFVVYQILNDPLYPLAKPIVGLPD
ncbi:15466_t:CDS:2, partial [Funneliformis geosporum]